MRKRENIKKRAEKRESKAKFLANRARQKDRYTKVRHTQEIKRLYRKASEEFRIAGDLYTVLKKKDKAGENYQKAKKYYNEGRGLGLEKYFSFAILAIVNFVLALFFISFNITGHSVGQLTSSNCVWIGICLFLFGLMFALVYFKNKKRI